MDSAGLKLQEKKQPKVDKEKSKGGKESKDKEKSKKGKQDPTMQPAVSANKCSDFSVLCALNELNTLPLQWKNCNPVLTATDYCKWLGVTCTNDIVTGIGISSGNGQSVVVPTSLACLTSLTSLVINSAGLIEIPSVIASLTNLVTLGLESNHFIGTQGTGTAIPTFLGGLHKLKSLNLQNNNALVGPIPSQLCDITGLTYLNLGADDGLGHVCYPACLSSVVELYLSGSPVCP